MEVEGLQFEVEGQGCRSRGYFGVNTPPPPTFWRTQKMEVKEGGQ